MGIPTGRDRFSNTGKKRGIGNQTLAEQIANGTVGDVHATNAVRKQFGLADEHFIPVAGSANNIKQNATFLSDEGTQKGAAPNVWTSALDNIAALQTTTVTPTKNKTTTVTPTVKPKPQSFPPMQDTAPASPVQSPTSLVKQPQQADDRLGLEALILGMSSLAMPEAPPVTDFYERDAKRVADELFQKEEEQKKQELADDYLNNPIFREFIDDLGFSPFEMSNDALIDLGEDFKKNNILSPNQSYLQDYNRYRWANHEQRNRRHEQGIDEELHKRLSPTLEVDGLLKSVRKNIKAYIAKHGELKDFNNFLGYQNFFAKAGSIEAANLNASLTDLKNVILKIRSGAAVTESEKRRLDDVLDIKGFRGSVNSLYAGLKVFEDIVANRIKNAKVAFGAERVNRYLTVPTPTSKKTTPTSKKTTSITPTTPGRRGVDVTYNDEVTLDDD